MEPNKTFLVPVDFEAASMAAVRKALELAQPSGARVVVLNVFNLPPYAFHGISDELMTRIRSQARAAALRPLHDLRARWGVETLLREGQPTTEILRAADELDASAIIMGTHGHRGFDRFMFGSTAEGVVRRASVPVMVVRPDEQPLRPPREHRVVLCAIDLQPGSQPVLELARRFAQEIDATLELVHAHAAPFYVYPAFDPVLAQELDAELTRTANKSLEKLATEYGAVKWHLVAGEAGRAILAAAGEVEPAAIVMGTHGRHGFGRVFLGSVAEWVLRRSPFPVLVTHVSQAAEAGDEERAAVA